MVLQLLAPTTVLQVKAPVMLEVLAPNDGVRALWRQQWCSTVLKVQAPMMATAVQPFLMDELLAPAAVMKLSAPHMVAEVLARVAVMEELAWRRFLAQQR